MPKRGSVVNTTPVHYYNSVNTPPLIPYWQTSDEETVRLYQGHVIDVLARLPPLSVHCVVTSPPYWGLRDYGQDKKLEIGSEPSPDCGTRGQAQCRGCFICTMVAFGRGVKRVLRDDGTFWLNLGDSYSSDHGQKRITHEDRPHKWGKHGDNKSFKPKDRHPPPDGIPAGNLCGIPWRVALALQADGWVLRQDIIWQKPSPMPESVQNRCTKSHEYVFLLTKGMKYFCDMEAIKEKGPGSNPRGHNASVIKERNDNGRILLGASGDRYANKRSVWSLPDERNLLDWLSLNHPETLAQYLNESRNKGNVWRIASQGYPGAHFATFPENLITPMILAGTSAKGCCSKCGKPWQRVTLETKLKRERPNEYVKRTGEAGTGNSCANTVAGVEVKTVGWQPGCKCFIDEQSKCRKCGADWASGPKESAPYVAPSELDRYGTGDHGVHRKIGSVYQKHLDKLNSRPIVERNNPCQCFSAELIPCTILDPFIGSGTTCAVSLEHGRRSIGIDLSEDYLVNNAIPRIEGVLLSRHSLAHLMPDRVGSSLDSYNSDIADEVGIDALPYEEEDD